jgi:hypothetical protein
MGRSRRNMALSASWADLPCLRATRVADSLAALSDLTERGRHRIHWLVQISVPVDLLTQLAVRGRFGVVKVLGRALMLDGQVSDSVGSFNGRAMIAPWDMPTG